MLRYDKLSKDLYIRNRQKLAAQMAPGGLAIFHSNDIMPTSADGTMPFKQSADIFYLSGVDQEESILVVFPDSFHAQHKEVLFLKETNENIAIWEGAKLTKDEAHQVSGIKTVYWLNQFDRIIHGLMSEASCVYLNSNEHTRAVVEVETRDARMGKAFREQYPNHRYERSAPIMHRIRSVKEQEEIDQMQRACNITRDGFNRVARFVKPGVKEYEIEAEFMHEFLSQGSRGFAYTPIIASGFNACVLHYIENSDVCKEGDVLLMDVGAEYGNYASDMTRCLPVSGRFTDRQRSVYNAVLSVMREAMTLLRPGVYLHEYHKQVGELMTKQLLDLKLIDRHDVDHEDPAWPAYKKYFMHGTSHFLGIDVHDVGLWNQPIQAGHIFTVEPGIYIREENLGIRLENDIVITENGFIDLMGDIPLEAEHVEETMNTGVAAS
ncbi:MAG: aminopeptidase P family protein [Flavobacteriales bacterium]|nr:aminopeptidase P family protein [Flavobacteriales bacterium]